MVLVQLPLRRELVLTLSQNTSRWWARCKSCPQWDGQKHPSVFEGHTQFQGVTFVWMCMGYICWVTARCLSMSTSVQPFDTSVNTVYHLSTRVFKAPWMHHHHQGMVSPADSKQQQMDRRRQQVTGRYSKNLRRHTGLKFGEASDLLRRKMGRLTGASVC